MRSITEELTKHPKRNCAPFDEKINQAQKLLDENPNIQFLVQSDEPEFVEKALAAFPNNSFFCKEELDHKINFFSERHLLDANRPFIQERMEYFAAMIYIMSKCKHMIVSRGGNCDIWMVLLRGHAKNVIQYFDGEWVYT